MEIALLAHLSTPTAYSARTLLLAPAAGLALKAQHARPASLAITPTPKAFVHLALESAPNALSATME